MRASVDFMWRMCGGDWAYDNQKADGWGIEIYFTKLNSKIIHKLKYLLPTKDSAINNDMVNREVR